MAKLVVLISGPIGAGKTTIGRALAEKLGGRFIEGDEYGDPAVAGSDRAATVAAEIVRQSKAALEAGGLVIAAWPLRLVDFEAIRMPLFASGMSVRCVTLSARYDAIVKPGRGRAFTRKERARIKEMISEGYASRDFSDAVINTELNDTREAVELIAADIETWMR